jgi:hypothetical protein
MIAILPASLPPMMPSAFSERLSAIGKGASLRPA